MRNLPTPVRLALLVGGVAVALIGLLLLRREVSGLGLSLVAAGIATYLWASIKIQQNSPSLADLQGFRGYLVPTILGLLSAASVFAVVYLISSPELRSGYSANMLWVAALVLLLAAAYWLEPLPHVRPRAIRAWWAVHRNELLLVLLILVVAVLARTVDLGQHPYPWSGDEASVGIEGRRILAGEVTDFFDTGWSGQPNWSFLPTALTLRIFGDDIIGVRMASAIPGILAVLFVYLLGREMFSAQVGLIAGIFLAVFPLQVHFSRVGVNNVHDSFVVVLVLWLVFRALRTGYTFDYALAGVGTGLAVHTYVGTRLVFLIGVGTLIYMALVRPGFLRANLKQNAVFVVAVLITILPMSYYFANHPDIFLNRIGQEGILFNGWLTTRAQQLGTSVLSVLGDQISRSTMVFVAHGAPANFFNSPQPYLTLLGSLLFLIGMGVAFSRLRQSEHAILLAWFWSVVILGGILTLNPPSNTRMLMTAPALALFVALGVSQVVIVMSRLYAPPRWQAVAAAGLVSVLCFESSLFYFVEYRNNAYFQDASGEVAMEAGLQLMTLGPHAALFMLGEPRVYVDFPTLDFVAPVNNKQNLFPSELDLFQRPAGPALFIAIPENLDSLRMLQASYPGGDWQKLQRKTKTDEVLFYSYTLPAP